MINNDAELFVEVGVTSFPALDKAIYKGTSCGATVQKIEGGIRIGSIVEGVDGDGTEYHELKYPFEITTFWNTVQAVEDEAEEIWNEAQAEQDDSTEIHLSVHGIVITLVDNQGDRWGGGSIVSDLKEKCPCCGQVDCYAHCEDSTESDEEWDGRKRFNDMMDALESMVLAHAIAGIDVTTPAYLEGLETALDGCAHETS